MMGRNLRRFAGRSSWRECPLDASALRPLQGTPEPLDRLWSAHIHRYRIGAAAGRWCFDNDLRHCYSRRRQRKADDCQIWSSVPRSCRCERCLEHAGIRSHAAVRSRGVIGWAPPRPVAAALRSPSPSGHIRSRGCRSPSARSRSGMRQQAPMTVGPSLSGVCTSLSVWRAAATAAAPRSCSRPLQSLAEACNQPTGAGRDRSTRPQPAPAARRSQSAAERRGGMLQAGR
jgi:hypothetical protein